MTIIRTLAGAVTSGATPSGMPVGPARDTMHVSVGIEAERH